MPLPLILGGAAAAAAAAGVGSAIHGGVKMKKAHDTMKSAEQQHQNNIARFEAQNKQTTEAMDALGKKELEILESFQKFSDIFDRIQNRPEFQEYSKDDVKIPMYDAEKLKEVSVGAGRSWRRCAGHSRWICCCRCDNSRRHGLWDSLYRNGHCLVKRCCGNECYTGCSGRRSDCGRRRRDRGAWPGCRSHPGRIRPPAAGSGSRRSPPPRR